MRGMVFGVVCVLATGLAGCDYPVRNDPIDGPYRLVAVTQPEEMSICYQTASATCITRVEATVFAYGFNKDYIVAARHPQHGYYVPADRTKTEYLYVVRADDGPKAGPRAIQGPFDLETFTRVRAERHLPPIDHDISSEIDWVSPPPPASKAPASTP